MDQFDAGAGVDLEPGGEAAGGQDVAAAALPQRRLNRLGAGGVVEVDGRLAEEGQGGVGQGAADARGQPHGHHALGCQQGAEQPGHAGGPDVGPGVGQVAPGRRAVNHARAERPLGGDAQELAVDGPAARRTGDGGPGRLLLHRLAHLAGRCHCGQGNTEVNLTREGHLLRPLADEVAVEEGEQAAPGLDDGHGHDRGLSVGGHLGEGLVEGQVVAAGAPVFGEQADGLAAGEGLAGAGQGALEAGLVGAFERQGAAPAQHRAQAPAVGPPAQDHAAHAPAQGRHDQEPGQAVERVADQQRRPPGGDVGAALDAEAVEGADEEPGGGRRARARRARRPRAARARRPTTMPTGCLSRRRSTRGPTNGRLAPPAAPGRARPPRAR